MTPREQVVQRIVGHLQSTAEGQVGGFGDHARAAPAVRAALASGEDSEGRLAHAVAVLHSFSRDPAVLTRAAARYTQPTSDPMYLLAAQLLAKAGADLDEAAAWWREHAPKGWNPPQADPDVHGHGGRINS